MEKRTRYCSVIKIALSILPAGTETKGGAKASSVAADRVNKAK
jgi:hypothetical protein